MAPLFRLETDGETQLRNHIARNGGTLTEFLKRYYAIHEMKSGVALYMKSRVAL